MLPGSADFITMIDVIEITITVQMKAEKPILTTAQAAALKDERRLDELFKVGIPLAENVL